VASQKKSRSPRNRTLSLSEADRDRLLPRLTGTDALHELTSACDITACADALAALDALPAATVDLVIADPPYNLDKVFNKRKFSAVDNDTYCAWLDSWIAKLPRLLKPNASIYICGDWRSSAAIQAIGSKYFKVHNRITWEREKGRGSLTNWKNASEDIWFFSVGREYTFNVDAVKVQRRVIAPYTDKTGAPKDWHRSKAGDFRLTHPSNLWTDLTVPFWSMPENTDHPTQKPEKLLAKLILTSSNPGDLVLDPFAGAGTTSVVAKKLQRHYIGVEIDEKYCLLTERRLEIAEDNPAIQGYQDGVFWERNSQPPR
jgi:site-specific DNA-methyltransferase (adenine-specific)